MQENDLIQLVDNLKRKKVEDNFIEIKAANKGCPTKLYDTISAFSNQMKAVKLYLVFQRMPNMI